ncbi:hypothetical protein EYC98_17595 [Halieaceae bacterium IMCC14734]|uniref:Uncharacterized protein n=1 Tax=Candidatus Litorirhabdus singularis TaxID=2518993 RepID=A0ABT3TMT4_9GAMM|nr:hypothetical protein [Candidatus Litorirhabdus singularis]MCX2982679.1 hypothetical protein [Candidatus Litorirhabdus singularis]
MSHTESMNSLADSVVVTELAIVDLFTKLIFGADAELSQTELHILGALRAVESSLLLQSGRDVGFYLRALCVSDMITLVNRVHEQSALSHRASTAQSPVTAALSISP